MKKVIVGIIVLIILFFYLIIIKVNNNFKYDIDILNKITQNYETEEEILSYKIDRNNYLITTHDNVIVLNDKYEEILKISLDTISDNPNNYEFTYKNNNLFFLEKSVQSKSITYKYYNIYTYEQELEVTIGG